MIKKFDTDQDGQVSLEEFKEVMKLAQEDVPPILKGIFDVGHFFSDEFKILPEAQKNWAMGSQKAQKNWAMGSRKAQKNWAMGSQKAQKNWAMGSQKAQKNWAMGSQKAQKNWAMGSQKAQKNWAMGSRKALKNWAMGSENSLGYSDVWFIRFGFLIVLVYHWHQQRAFVLRFDISLISVMAASSVSSNLSDGQLSNEKIEQLFRKFDTSDDGYIESGELKMALQEGENCHGDAEIYDMIKKFDKDQDGQVSLEEFQYVMELRSESVLYWRGRLSIIRTTEYKH
eukprot:CAMPEP_0185794016 /NCGR_PEP_ID=MMETSP1174-20130828/159789_1 /TAXON_ID=35687 /ORGANISM="Dictyocha speculum, Strain CCMP1381" /LENGTH=283 /DNA_ID=CAMNT_0028489215 /DNA_START=102 /DNA_END=953 /DNA_ORIENTATION=+